MQWFVPLSLILTLGLTASPSAQAQFINTPYIGLGRAPTQVNSRLWRSGRPTVATLTQLAKQGVRVIIDLEDDADAIQAEAILARQMGFTFYSYPTSGFWLPDDQQINQIMTVLSTSKVPVLVHCLHGEDRTGLIVGLERVQFEKWPAGFAYQEMQDNGFHDVLIGLTAYFNIRAKEVGSGDWWQ